MMIKLTDVLSVVPVNCKLSVSGSGNAADLIVQNLKNGAQLIFVMHGSSGTRFAFQNWFQWNQPKGQREPYFDDYVQIVPLEGQNAGHAHLRFLALENLTNKVTIDFDIIASTGAPKDPTLTLIP